MDKTTFETKQNIDPQLLAWQKWLYAPKNEPQKLSSGDKMKRFCDAPIQQPLITDENIK